MDNEKTGKLIYEIRQKKNMTQQDIADKLHITSKAVSKWERGLSFPSVDVLESLAGVLEISVIDLLAGEIIQTQNVISQTNAVSLQILKKEQKTKSRFTIMVIALIGVILLLIFGGYRNVIFQCGNPIPYLLASMSISDDTPYVEVGNDTGIYIAKKGECPELFEFVQEKWNVEFVEQFGSDYEFTNGLDTLTLSSEIYFRYFTVWKVPQYTLQSK